MAKKEADHQYAHFLGLNISKDLFEALDAERDRLAKQLGSEITMAQTVRSLLERALRADEEKGHGR